MRDDDIEMVEHLMVFCKHTLDVWVRLYKWWGCGSFSNFSIDEVFNGDGSGVQSLEGKKLWQAIEWVCGYVIWNNRNQKFFRNKVSSGANLLSDIQVKSYEWITIRPKGKHIEWHEWLINPRFYIGSCPQRMDVV
ncbi:uncharacterized protein [Rutidosis leptorrhynchoides]|uniref:uncharacterized protein n=1 Tax=Rutidosis leptorrhynchoides TaxID=125765 RepID=UPI003A99B209